MDLDEWEILPRTGFLDYRERAGDHAGDNSFTAANKRCVNTSRTLFNMDYFVCPPSSSSPPRTSRILPHQQIFPVSFQLEPTKLTDDEDHEEQKKPVVSSVMISDEVKGPDKEAKQDPVSQVFFKKMNENKFVDMKIDYPEFNFEDKVEGFIKGENLEIKISSPRIKKDEEEDEEEVNWEESDDGGLNLWRWSLNGIGAICSFGVAVATVCIVIFGTHQRNKRNNHKLRFQIYTDDKRVKQVVHYSNEAMAAVRGVPMSRAHVTCGGYYEGV